MYIVDSSVWIEYLRRTGSRADAEVTKMVERESPNAGVTEPVIMELLAGARSRENFIRLQELMDAMPLCSVSPLSDFTEAGALYRYLRAKGMTIQSKVDCLIAAVASRRDATIVHADRDFDTIASCYPVQVMSLV